MPFASEAQRRFLFAKHPDIAKRWAHKYGTPADLPAHVAKKHVMKRRIKRSRQVD